MARHNKSMSLKRSEKLTSAAKAVGVQQEVERLAGLDEAAYDAERKTIAEKLGLQRKTLDKLVRKGRVKAGVNASGPFTPVAPWDKRISGAKLLDAIERELQRLIRIRNEEYTIITLWVVHAHAVHRSRISPRLHLSSAQPGCGKTTLLEVISNLVPKTSLTASITQAALFRSIETWGPTLLLDEVDFTKKDSDVVTVLNSGHRRNGAKVLRQDRVGAPPSAYDVFGAVAFATLDSVPAALASRSINIRLRPPLPSEKVERLTRSRVERLQRLARKAARWVQDHGPALQDSTPEFPADLRNRVGDNWLPLLAIADEAGKSWPAQSRQAARNYAQSSAADQPDGVRLLTDIRRLIGDQEKMQSAHLAKALASHDDHFWGNWKGHGPITPSGIAQLLKPYDIGPKSIRTSTEVVVRGYGRSQFDDAFRRYLPPMPHDEQRKRKSKSLKKRRSKPRSRRRLPRL